QEVPELAPALRPIPRPPGVPPRIPVGATAPTPLGPAPSGPFGRSGSPSAIAPDPSGPRAALSVRTGPRLKQNGSGRVSLGAGRGAQLGASSPGSGLFGDVSEPSPPAPMFG